VLPPVDATSTATPVPADATLPARVLAALRSPALGPDVTVSVVDVASGDVLVAHGDQRGQQPASTLKVLTAASVLRALGPDTRLSTSVVAGPGPGELVLVGAGDATLTRVPAPPSSLPPGQSARPASLIDLATRTAAAVRATGRTSVTVSIDDSLFTGPHVAPGWPASYVATGIVSPVFALSADSGKVSATSRVRDADPALSAAHYFVTRLRAAGLTVTGTVTRTVTSSTNAVVASVQSPTLSELVERMLTVSDDDLAEALAHLAGGVDGGSASFAGGARAARVTLDQLGAPTNGVTIVDGSGLSLHNLMTAQSQVRLLAAVALDAPMVGSTAGVLWPASTGLPVAGVTGTLLDRFRTAGTLAGRGVVRAKTGTLSDVSDLSGVVRDTHGRLLAFSFLADSTPGPVLDARAALDRAATVVARA
jgi:D-alanyl-D-alanine carboxypeptidase/D-alanyl-D-alanine-endopeptidase (penicillin-binding protein 4)